MAWCLFIVGLFAAVGWICLRRPRPRPRTVADREKFFVELVTTSTVDEARALAHRLQRAGIVALANAEPLPPDTYGRHGYRPFVAVLEIERERARAALDAMHTLEGNVPHAEITAALAEDAAREEAAGARSTDESYDDALDGETAHQRTLQRIAEIGLGVVRWFVIAIVAGILITLLRSCG